MADEFGKRLKAVFKDASNAVIASKIGVSEPTVSTYLNGRIPPADNLRKIAKITNCNLHWLLTGDGEKFLPPEQVAELNKKLEGITHSVDPQEILTRPSILDGMQMMFSMPDTSKMSDVERAAIKLDLEKNALYIQLKLKELELEEFYKNNRITVYEPHTDKEKTE